MVGGVLGFNTNTKKSDVGNYFKTIETSLTTTKTALNKIVADMKSENNPNAEATGVAVRNLIDNTLDKIIDGAKIASEAIGITGDDLLGNIADKGAGDNTSHGAGAKSDSVENLIKGVKSIVDIVLGKEGSADAGTDKKAEDGGQRSEGNAGDGEATKLFVGAGNAGDAGQTKKSATDAAKAVGAVTGADILKAMIKDNGDAAAANAKDGTIAGAIALRAMAKDGKSPGVTATAAADNPDYTDAVKGAAVSAVTKSLNTLTIAIRNTVDSGLKTINEALAAVKQEDKSLDSTTPADTATVGQNSK
ncbi:vlp protein, gamma subfamily (plasmid) [Borrelia turicatae]|uniref:Variable large protein n=1 Tax=Borrelia turicatae TaxID=142 RepID=A0A172XD35_BORTU|nr:vlp protein, gamma subfamily [Borrelia turicatae]UPA15651.1 variable large family protein [Borrelia turicatae]